MALDDNDAGDDDDDGDDVGDDWRRHGVDSDDFNEEQDDDA